MIKAGRLKDPYKGPIDAFRRVISEEGVAPLWRGNVANCLRYFPTQALNFMFKERLSIFIYFIFYVLYFLFLFGLNIGWLQTKHHKNKKKMF